jgi:hypothetical protein
MSIRFTCELADPHTESLLLFLEELLGDNEEHKLQVLSCAQQWLEMRVPSIFNRGDAHVKSSLLLVGDRYVPDVPEP